MKVAGRPDSQIGISCQKQGPIPGAFGEVTFGKRLHPPGDPSKQELPVHRPAAISEQVFVLFSELSDREITKLGNLFSKLSIHGVGICLPAGDWSRETWF